MSMTRTLDDVSDTLAGVQIVVGAAILRHGRVLAARRAVPADLAGQWEFPGGKVEPGESDVAGLVRECREELGVQIAVGELLGCVEPPGLALRVYVAELIAGEPQPLADHDELRWLGAAELDDVPWLPADLPLVAALRARF
jgi:8-oxo-dGTP diphosphatase